MSADPQLAFPQYWEPDGWKVLGTGGECTSLVNERPDGWAYFVTAADWRAPADPLDLCSLGRWNPDEGEDVLAEDVAAAEAVRLAEEDISKREATNDNG